MFEKLLSKLEDPNYPLLGPNIKCLKFWGLLLPEEKTFMRKFYICVHSCMFCFMITEFIDIWYIGSDMNQLITNMKSTMLAIVSVNKVVTYLWWQKDWKNIMAYVTKADIEARTSTDEENREIITVYTRYCRRISYLYWLLTYTTAAAVIALPMSYWFSSSTYRDNVRDGTEDYYQVVSSWVPFNKNKLGGYLAASAVQSFATTYCGGWISSYDTNAIVIMVFFKAELQLIKNRCSKIFEVDDEEEIMNRIKECHRRHNVLVKYVKQFDSCLSPVMFLYMIACSVMLCSSLYQTTSQASFTQKLLTTPYLLLGVSQLFMYSWHGNEVSFMSNELIRGIYESGWWKKATVRREIILLVGTLDRPIEFTAGPFFNLTIAVFVRILKGAYSYYMIIIKK
ncbi:odorant receptor Or2 isoform X1 [Plutella xylostella]|uniref:Odorant receptor n=1 Tax=Plutella xylostella TaxID=51655 RepID=A0A8G1GME0_PLUXY|nr:odorant receptor Or2 isoform X1 [Plutella xylostella]QZA75625.1 odorant receptor 24 [Plutella xylostella]